jgi:hypothetical protein
MNILTQIVESYLSPDYDPNCSLLDHDKAKEYFSNFLDSKNVLYLTEGGWLIAWMEVWFLDEEQTKRVVLDKDDKFDPRSEDVLTGSVCYVSDIFIVKEHRGNDNNIIWKLWKIAEEVHGRPEVITFERRRLDSKFRVFKGGG